MSPGALDRVWFTSSGSEAIEAALKLARQYHLERGDTGRSRVIARRLSYHGNTLGALAAGGSAWRRAPYEPLLIDVSLVDPCFEYRFAEPGESAEAYGRRAADCAGSRRSSGSARRPSWRSSPRRSSARPPARCRRCRIPPAHVREICDAPRRAPDPRRGDVRLGPHRHLPVVRAGRRRPRHRHARERPGRAAISRSARSSARADVYDAVAQRLGRAQARPDLQCPSGRLRRRARGPAGDPRGASARPSSATRASG